MAGGNAWLDKRGKDESNLQWTPTLKALKQYSKLSRDNLPVSWRQMFEQVHWGATSTSDAYMIRSSSVCSFLAAWMTVLKAEWMCFRSLNCGSSIGPLLKCPDFVSSRNSQGTHSKSFRVVCNTSTPIVVYTAQEMHGLLWRLTSACITLSFSTRLAS